MDAAAWALIVGALLVLMGISGASLRNLPLSTAMLYLPVGLAISPLALDLARFDPIADARLLEHLSEIVVVVSLFSVGLKLNLSLEDRRWLLPLRLALGSMMLTVGLIALAGLAMGLPLGLAVLLGAVLAPTDPVLASDVQVADPQDRSRLRMALTGEGGLNDGTAFPFVMLGLGLLGLHTIGEAGVRWLLVDVVWAVVAGLAIGAALGTLIGKLVLHLRLQHRQAVGYDDFLALGLVGLSYGAALLATSYGFLAVFAAGVALRRVERKATRAQRLVDDESQAEDAELVRHSLTHPRPRVDADQVATDPAHAPAFLAHAMLGSTEKIERIGEVAAVVMLGAMLWSVEWWRVPWWFVPLLFLVIRPLAVVAGLAGTSMLPTQRGMIAWFGVRGIGSLYYMAYAITHGVAGDDAKTLVALTLTTVVASIVAHGISVTPLMARYERRSRRKSNLSDAPDP